MEKSISFISVIRSGPYKEWCLTKFDSVPIICTFWFQIYRIQMRWTDVQFNMHARCTYMCSCVCVYVYMTIDAMADYMCE